MVRLSTAKLASVLILFFLTSCGWISKGSGDENWFLAFLGIGKGKPTPQIPKYRIDGFLRSADNQQPLRRHGLEKSGILHLTNASGKFSLYLNPGKHTIRVSDPNGVDLGSFSFQLESPEILPEVTYSGQVPFLVVWEEIIPLPQSTIDLTAGQAEVVINEVSPGISSANGGDIVELFVTLGGNLLSTSICVRNVCSDLPEVRVRSGEFILLREGEGVNDTIPLEGPHPTAWDFYVLPSMTTTDSVVYIRSRGVPYASVLKYANNNQVWNGCNGSSGNVSCIPPILNSGQWSQAGTEFDESDAVLKTPPGNFGNNDTIIRCPIGSKATGKSAYLFSSTPSERTFGTANTSCPEFALVSAVADSSTTLTVTYNLNPTVSSASNPANYSIYEGSNCSGTQLPVNSVSLSGQVATLGTNLQTQGANYVVCVLNVTSQADNKPLLGNQAFFMGFAPSAQLTLNEVAPGMPSGTDYVEIFVLDGGTTSGLRLCNRTTCVNFPERIVDAGDYIVFYAVSGVDDANKSDGLDPNFWEFYGAPNMETTDSIVTIRLGNTVESALAYANGDNSWTGGTYINTVVSQGKWPQAGPSWVESDAQMKSPPSNFGSNDTLIKIPNGTGVDNKTVWTVSTNPGDRTIGYPNSPPLPPPVINPGDLVINELRRRSNGHFFEIRNMTSSAIDLNAGNVHFYRAATCQDPLSSTTWTNKLKLTGIIPANGYYLVTSVALGIGENEVRSHSYGSNGCAILTKSSVNPSSITDSSVVDAVGWGTSAICKGTCATDLADNGVLRRTGSFQPLSGGNNSLEFTFNANCAGTPGADNANSGGCVLLGAVPTFSLAAGWHPAPTTTNITTSGADSIRYTLDGSNPNCHANGTVINGNSGSAPIDMTLTIKAVSCKAGIPSTTAERSFVIGGPPPPSLTGIFFNEFRRKSSNHWFELINTNGYSVDLDAANAHVWRRAGCDTSTFVSTTPLKLTGTIPANGYYLVAVSGSDVDSIADQTTSSSGVAAVSTNNCIALTNSATAPTGPSDPSVQDLVGWGSAQFFKGTVASNPPDGGILRRFPNGSNTNNNNADFGTVTSCDGTPKAANISACPDFTPPTVASTNPANTATNVSINTTIQITFSEPMQASTITTNTANTTCSGSLQVSDSSAFSSCVQMASLSNLGNTWTLTPNSALATNTLYYVRVTTAVQDLAGNNLASTYIGSFTTGTSAPPTNLIVNGSFEDDTNSCTQSASPVGCPNGWIYYTGAATSTLSAVPGGTPSGGGSNYGTLSTWTTTYTNRQIRSSCFAIDKSKQLNISGYFYKDSPNSTQIRFLIHYFTNSNCTTPTSPPTKTFPGHSINLQDTWENKSNTETTANYPTDPVLYARLAIEGQRATSGGIRFDLISVTQP